MSWIQHNQKPNIVHPNQICIEIAFFQINQKSVITFQTWFKSTISAKDFSVRTRQFQIGNYSAVPAGSGKATVIRFTAVRENKKCLSESYMCAQLRTPPEIPLHQSTIVLRGLWGH